MIVLEFVGRDPESDALLFTDEAGSEYTAALTEPLAAAIRRGATLDTIANASRNPLSPGQIQALLREGMTAAQVAEQTDTELARVRRYEGPVLAEIARAVDSTRSSRVGSERDAPTIGDLVVDRLAERGVDTKTLDWRAARRGAAWEVTVAFVEGDIERSASWTLSEPGNLAVAADDTARELTESARTPEPVRALFPPVHSSTLDPHEAGADGLLDRQEQLLKRLNAARGRRQPVMLGFDGLDETETVEDAEVDVVEVDVEAEPEPKSAPQPELTVLEGITSEAQPGETAVETETEETTDPAPTGESESDAPEEETPEPQIDVVEAVEEVTDTPRKRGRTPVPSWDEIVFGSRTD